MTETSEAGGQRVNKMKNSMIFALPSSKSLVGLLVLPGKWLLGQGIPPRGEWGEERAAEVSPGVGGQPARHPSAVAHRTGTGRYESEMNVRKYRREAVSPDV